MPPSGSHVFVGLSGEAVLLRLVVIKMVVQWWVSGLSPNVFVVKSGSIMLVVVTLAFKQVSKLAAR